VVRILGRYVTETVLNWVSVILLCIISVACTIPASTPEVHIRADAEQTVAGGNPILLSASSNAMDSTVSWRLEDSNPGKLDSESGSTVRYLPPAAGTIAHPVLITVSATAAGVTLTILLSVQPSMPRILRASAGTQDKFA
jgi:hypothetical protein